MRVKYPSSMPFPHRAHSSTQVSCNDIWMSTLRSLRQNRTSHLIDALPTTAVGKIVKNDLRDRAVSEKVKIEAERIFGATITPVVAVAKDEKLNTVVLVEVPTNDAASIQKLKDALQQLPQTYTVVARPV